MKAQIVGWSHLPFGKREEPDVEALLAAVARPALDHAGVDPRDVDAVYVGVMNNGFSRQGFEASLVGVAVPELAATPATRLEIACATGSAAIHAALDFIEAGRGRIALVLGAEKMTALPTADVGNVLLCASYHKEESALNGFAGIFGHVTRQYFDRYGDCSEALALIAAKNHANGVANPFAQIRKDLGFEFCNTVSDRNPYVAEPLRRTDCSLISDGAAALVLADADTAQSLSRRISFRARQQANDVLPLSRRDPLQFAGAERAWKSAMQQAGVHLSDLSLLETHDCFTIAELLQYEAMGLAARGAGSQVIRDGVTCRDGVLPVNPSGGLKSKGHPIGATGVSMHVMACLQLTGEAGGMQIPDARLAAVFNMGGVAVANYVSILEC
ncbi:MAG: acetyl-CoA acetyltransferase [Planctomycetaceae bacterium]|nr:acetyl-CoA acetyltransferase [Planctomycetaceae bacterium]